MTTERTSWLPAKSWRHLLAGALGGSCGTLLTLPLDVVKTRLQASTASSHSGGVWRHLTETVGIVRSVYTSDGVRGMYTGLLPTLLAVVPARAVNFWVYGTVKSLIPGDSSVVHLVAAAHAGVATSVVTNPIWVVRTRMQLQQRQAGIPISAWATVKSIQAKQGGRGFYSGLSASMLGVSESAIQWVLYEKFKKIAVSSSSSSSASSSASSSSSSSTTTSSSANTPTTALSTVLASGSAKTIATVLTYPHEVIRTRLRQGLPLKYKSLVQTAKLIAKEEGGRAFYNGLSAHLMRVIPNAVVTFTIFEAVMRNT